MNVTSDLGKAPSPENKFEEFDFPLLLDKYGPEGLLELSIKLKQLALNDYFEAITSNMENES